MSKEEIAVKCSQVIKTYDQGENAIVALRGIDLEVKSGELIILAGPSGCGKTTLISVIAGILNQDSGECEVYSHSLSRMSKTERIAFRAKNIGFVF